MPNNSKLNEFIFEIIKYPNKTRSIADLADIFKVSKRTIQNRLNDFEKLYAFLNLHNLISYGSKTICYIGTPEDTKKISSHIASLNLYDFYANTNERITIIVLKLLLFDKHLSIDKIIEELYISQSTFFSDLIKVKSYFKQYNIEVKSSNNCYYIETTEQKRQDIIYNTISPYLANEKFFGGNYVFNSSFLKRNLNIQDIFDDVFNIVSEVENIFNLSISDILFRQTVYKTSILCSRLLQNKFIEKIENINSKILTTSVGEIANSLLRRLNKQLGVVYGEKEVLYLAKSLHLLHFDFTSNFEHSIDFYFYIEVVRFLNAIDLELNTNFNIDHDFTIMFVRHIWAMRNSNSTEYDFSDVMLYENYKKYLNIVEKHISIIETCIKRQCSKNEKLSILLYVISARERYITKRKIKIIVLCHIGIGTGHYLALRLQETFNVEIIDVIATHKLPTIENRNDFDLIISTIPLDNKKLNHITISPSLDDSDIITVQKSIVSTLHKSNSYSKINRNAKNNRIIDIIDKIDVVLDANCDNVYDSLLSAATPLLKKNKIEKRYIDSIMKSIETNGPYFVFWKGVALAHSFPTAGVNDLCISICRLSKPIVYGHAKNDPVEIVILVGIANPDTQVKYITDLMNIFSNPIILNQIKQCKTKTEIIDILVNSNITIDN